MFEELIVALEASLKNLGLDPEPDWIQIQLQPGSGSSTGSSLDPDQATAWIQIRIQQNVWIRLE
jgi:hypothetical protein